MPIKGSNPDIDRRNQDIKDRFQQLCKQHPQWKLDAYLQELHQEFYLKPTTIQQIINGNYDKYREKRKSSNGQSSLNFD